MLPCEEARDEEKEYFVSKNKETETRAFLWHDLLA